MFDGNVNLVLSAVGCCCYTQESTCHFLGTFAKRKVIIVIFWYLLIQIGVILLEEGIYHILYMSQTFETLKPPMFVTVFFDASGTYWTPRAKAIQCLGYEGEDGGPGDYTPGDSLEEPWSPGALCRRWRLQFPQAICDVQVARSVGTTRAVRSMCVASTLP